MPDATGLELVAQRVRAAVSDDAVVSALHAHGSATLEVAPGSVHDVLEHLRDADEEPYEFLASVHGCDYLPEEPRLGVHYQLLSMDRAERLGVKTRLGTDDPGLRSVVDLFPTASFQEREVYDFFGVEFDGHPDPRRILMPEDYVGHPQRRDFPMGGEPVLFTFNEHKLPRWYD
ncbi:MAG: NADH-quinone oxidoreductase subunit C [Thermoleophilaceae bacterium]|nr:NADH-quinone oxidoreductase subunit C [Thermoleophilaceae bacterium]